MRPDRTDIVSNTLALAITAVAAAYFVVANPPVARPSQPPEEMASVEIAMEAIPDSPPPETAPPDSAPPEPTMPEPPTSGQPAARASSAAFRRAGFAAAATTQANHPSSAAGQTRGTKARTTSSSVAEAGRTAKGIARATPAHRGDGACPCRRRAHCATGSTKIRAAAFLAASGRSGVRVPRMSSEPWLSGVEGSAAQPSDRRRVDHRIRRQRFRWRRQSHSRGSRAHGRRGLRVSSWRRVFIRRRCLPLTKWNRG